MISLYNAAAKGYSKAINDLNKQSKPKVETEKTTGLLTRSMTRMPKEEGNNKEPYDMVLDAMKQIREYRSKL